MNGLSEPERERYLAERPEYLPPEEKMPKAARDRMSDFISALEGGADDERQARTVLIAHSERAPLFDGVAIHQKAK